MSINFNDVRTSLYNWVISNTPAGMPVIYLYNNSPRPTVDYLTLYISSVNQIGWDYVQPFSDNTGIEEQVGDREFTLNIVAYGGSPSTTTGDPLTVLNNLRTSLQKQTVLDTLRANGIAFANWFPINDLTTLIDSRFEPRASMDIIFRMADIYSDISGFINTVNYEQTYFDAKGTVVYNSENSVTT